MHTCRHTDIQTHSHIDIPDVSDVSDISDIHNEVFGMRALGFSDLGFGPSFRDTYDKPSSAQNKRLYSASELVAQSYHQHSVSTV